MRKTPYKEYQERLKLACVTVKTANIKNADSLSVYYYINVLLNCTQQM